MGSVRLLLRNVLILVIVPEELVPTMGAWLPWVPVWWMMANEYVRTIFRWRRG